MKTLMGVVIGVVLAAFAVYNHFAKASELACKVVEQNEINNEIIATSREIQTALKLLKENFASAGDRSISTQFMAQEIASTVDKIDKSLENVNQLRKTA